MKRILLSPFYRLVLVCMLLVVSGPLWARYGKTVVSGASESVKYTKTIYKGKDCGNLDVEVELLGQSSIENVLEVIMVVDMSGSMAWVPGEGDKPQPNSPNNIWRHEIKAAKSFAAKILKDNSFKSYDQKNKVGLVLYNELVESTNVVGLTTDLGRIESLLDTRMPNGGTNIVDGVERGIDELAKSDRPGCAVERVIVVFSDGKPYYAKSSRGQVARECYDRITPYTGIDATGSGLVKTPFNEMGAIEESLYLGTCLKQTIEYSKKEAWKVTVKGEESPVSFFTVAFLAGLNNQFGDYRGNCLYMMEKMQNSGCWYTNDAVGLENIYENIYESIKVSGRASNGVDFFSEEIKSPYSLVPGSITWHSDKSQELNVRQANGNIYMEAAKIRTGETIKLSYSVKVESNTCENISGEGLVTNSTYKAGKANCDEETRKRIVASDICVPCFDPKPVLTMEQVDCSRTIQYKVKFGNIKDCGNSATIKYKITFYSGNSLIVKEIPETEHYSGSSDPSGTFTLPTSVSLGSEIRGVLSANIETEDFCNGPVEDEKKIKLGDGLKLVVNDPPESCKNADLTLPAITAGSDTGGVLGYFYDEYLSQPIADPTNVGPGTYWISLKKGSGGEGCESKQPVVVKTKKPSSPIIELQPTKCGETTAKIRILYYNPDTQYTITPAASAGPIQSDGTFTVSAFGSYTVRLKDTSTDCESDESEPVIFEYKEQPPTPQIKIIEEASCTNAKYYIEITNFNKDYKYKLVNEGTGASFNITPYASGRFELEAQNEETKYKLIVEYNGCESEGAILITKPLPVTPKLPVATVATQPDCDNPNGKIVVTPVQTGVEYSLDGTTWQTENEFNNVAPGTYTVSARNISDPECIVKANTTVTINEVTGAPPVPTATKIDPDCNNPNGGSITVTPQPNVQYSIDGVNYTTNNVFSGLSAGVYKVYVKSVGAAAADGCSAVSKDSYELKVSGIDAPELTTTQPTCSVATGSITVSSPLGSQYTYSKDGATYVSSPVFANLASGNYTIYVKNTEGCIASSEATIATAPNKPKEPKAYLVQPNCNKTTGSIIVVKQDSNVEYSINGTDWGMNNKFENLTPKTYTVSIRSLADPDCMSQKDFTINPASDGLAKPEATPKNPGCDETTGSLTISNAEGGVQYSVNGTEWQTEATFDGLVAGTYTLYAKTNDGCTATGTATIVAPPAKPKAPLGKGEQPKCDYAFGKITIDLIPTAVEYRIDGKAWQKSNVFEGLPPGSYYMYVRNAEGCETKSPVPFVINEAPIIPELPSLEKVIQPKCNESTGTIIMENQSGVDLLYSLDGITWQKSNEFTNLKPGSYSIYAKGATGECLKVRKNAVFINVPKPAPDVPKIKEIKQPTCEETGYIIVEKQEGVEYSLDGVKWQESNEFRNLAAGKYKIHVRNLSDEDCIVTAVEEYTINPVDGAPDSPKVTKIDPDCTIRTGTITVTAPVGTQYEYKLDNGTWQDSPKFENLAAGDYKVIVRTKSGGCTTPAKESVTIKPAPALPTPPKGKMVAPDCDNPYGTIVIEQQQGVLYSIDEENWIPDYVFTSLEPGEYTIYVKSISTDPDVEGCPVAGTVFNIPKAEETPDKPEATVTQPTCETPVGSMVITPKANNLLYSVDRITWQESNVFDKLPPNVYKAYVKFKTGKDCVNESAKTYTILSIDGAPDLPEVDKIVQPNCDTPKGFIVIKPQTGVRYSIDGQKWQDSNIFIVDAGEYYLYMKSTSADGCESISKEKVKINDAPVIPQLPKIKTVVQPTCELSTGKIEVEAQAGVEYSLDGGKTWQDSNVFDKLTPQKYTVSLRSKGSVCETSSAETVEIIAAPGTPELPEVTNIKHPSCDPTSTGAIMIKAQEDMEYRLDNGAWQPVNVFPNVPPGEHLVYVRSTEGAGCESVSKEPIVIKEAPSSQMQVPTARVEHPDCERENGMVIVKSQENVEYKITGREWQKDTIFYDVVPQKNIIVQVRVAGNEDEDCWETATEVYTINERPAIPQKPEVTTIPPTCTEPTGTVIIEKQSGVEYSIDGVNWTAENTFSKLEPDNYIAYVRNIESGCIAKSDRTPLNPAEGKPDIPKGEAVQPTCEIATGTITIEKQENVEYKVTGSNWTSTNVFTELPSGPYKLYVRSLDDSECFSEGGPVVIEVAPDAPQKPEVSSVTEMSCSDTTGGFTLVKQDGVEYTLDGKTWTTSHTFSGLTPGDHKVTVRSIASNECTEETVVTIAPAPNAPKLPDVEVKHPTCLEPTGSLEFTKVSTVEYSIDKGASWTTTNVFDNLPSGSYFVQVRDAKTHCLSESKEYKINVAEGAPLTPVVENLTQPTCTNEFGRVVISKQPNVSYSLDKTNWVATNTFEKLKSGTYTIYVKSLTDGGCIASSQFVVEEQPLAPSLPKAKVTLPTCEEPYGTIEVEKQDDVQYSLDGQEWQTGNKFSQVASNDYTVYVRSMGGCVVSSTEKVTIPEAPEGPDAPEIDVVAGDNRIDDAERKKGIIVSGTATSGDKISVKWGGVTKEIIASDGRWQAFFAENEIPKEKSSTISATADRAGCTNTTKREIKTTDEVVDKSNIIANDDDMSDYPVDYVKGSSYVIDIFLNDILDGVTVEKDEVLLTTGTIKYQGEVITDSDVQINPNGFVSVAPGAKVGRYELTYTICDKFNPDNCDEAVVIIVVNKNCNQILSIKVPQFLSINEDDKNETWEIPDLLEFSKECGQGGNKVSVFDRPGTKLYEKDNYMFDNDRFEGVNTLGDGEKLPRGTYLYIIEVKGIKDRLTGFIFIHREEVEETEVDTF